MGNQRSQRNAPAILGTAGVTCAMLGLLAWGEHAGFAARGIFAAASRDMVTARRMSSHAGGFSLAQLLLGVLSIGLGWIARARGKDSRLARRLGVSAVCVGVIVLALLLLVV
jgi:hypothetical protein